MKSNLILLGKHFYISADKQFQLLLFVCVCTVLKALVVYKHFFTDYSHDYTYRKVEKIIFKYKEELKK